MKKQNRHYRKCCYCEREISLSNYNRHISHCENDVKKLHIPLKINYDWQLSNGLFECPYCKSQYSKKGICSHIILNHTLNGNDRRLKSNFKNYNDKIKSGILLHNKNQFELAKERGEKYIVSYETRKKISESKKGRLVSEKTRQLLSLKRSKYLEEVGGGGFTHIKWYKLKNNHNIEFILRGKWELLIGQLLNENNIHWIRKIYLQYHDECLCQRTYTPDFYIPEYDRYIEVKGYFSDKDKIKLHNVINENNIDLILIQQKDIENVHELIKKLIVPVSPLSYKQ